MNHRYIVTSDKQAFVDFDHAVLLVLYGHEPDDGTACFYEIQQKLDGSSVFRYFYDTDTQPAQYVDTGRAQLLSAEAPVNTGRAQLLSAEAPVSTVIVEMDPRDPEFFEEPVFPE